jgi:D-beta-D-heptose 7-phosphate kinase/D-beta-D-heptose 1-phosphate adenosyltransferase
MSVVVSGGFDPIHIGHLRMFHEAKALSSEFTGKLIVIVNNDEFLIQKKGYVFMPFEERMEIITGFKPVDTVIPSIDTDLTVCETLKGLCEVTSNNIRTFANGGDKKSKKHIPEADICEHYGVRLMFDVGGEKAQASSDLIKKVWKTIYEQLSNKKLPSSR